MARIASPRCPSVAETDAAFPHAHGFAAREEDERAGLPLNRPEDRAPWSC